MEFQQGRHIGDILKERNIILKGADAATRQGFTQVPNFILKSKRLSAGDKMTFAMLLSYAWQNDYCFPGQERLAHDLCQLSQGRGVLAHRGHQVVAVLAARLAAGYWRRRRAPLAAADRW